MRLPSKILAIARSAPCRHGCWFAAALLLALSARGQQHAHAASGSLSVFVPNLPYSFDTAHEWVYANGHLLGTLSSANKHSTDLIYVSTCKGFSFWSSNGRVLSSGDGRFRETPDQMAKSAVAYPNLFLTQTFQLPAGHYTVDVAFENVGTSCAQKSAQDYRFPFWFSLAFPVTVTAGHTAILYIPPPDAYTSLSSASAMPSARRGCPLVKNDQPSQDALAATQRGVQDFQNSPEVGALLQAAATYHALPNGHLRLQFPPEFGGTREYDADQVQLLTGFAPGVLDRLVFGDRLPTHALVASCREQYPQFAQTFDAYDKIIDFMQSKIDAINQLNQAVQTGR